ncbi:MAG: sugar phosphate isomerase/epimerase family protein [Clostridiaceae bacterium]|nr:sugar phosphate isomerase/epimerase family protein [Clostridiaceae bacterium]
MKLGTIIGLNLDELEHDLRKLHQMGFTSCQLCCWQPDRMTAESAVIVKKLAVECDIEISALWCGWEGPCEWNLIHGPGTIGLVPAAYRHKRLDTLMKGSEFAEMIGVTDVITHVGFIPNNPFDAEYTGLVEALRYLALTMKQRGQYFLFETGQEAPVTLLRTIEDIGTDNIGINLDPANLMMYGLGNPIDALSVFGTYVRNVHGKDGVCPNNGRQLGHETAIGQGMVNYPAFIRKLKEIGYDRYITIEREISGEQQTKDITAAKQYLEQLWAQA